MAKDLWAEAMSLLASRVSQQEIIRWLKPLVPEIVGRPMNLKLTAPNRFFIDWVRDHYLDLIREALATSSTGPINIQLSDGGPSRVSMAPAHKPLPTTQPAEQVSSNGLRPAYTFSNFVVGGCNQFAHAAALAVANRPGKTYNPLFVYGGAGLGKTHLINAVGNHIVYNHASIKVAYISCEDFTNQMILAIREKTMESFRGLYRSIGVLIVDDIHFLGTKERTQEEFFFTFNALYESGHQIILTSDQRPKEIPGLEERVRSRFEWGLITDLQMPDQETKVAILIKKADEEAINLPEEVAFFLASGEETNIRVLEGYLVRLAAFASMTDQPITLSLAKQVLTDFMTKREVSIDDILRLVALQYNVRLADLRSKKKERKIAEPRQIAMYLARRMTKTPLVKIGQKFGGKDHSTVIHAVKKIRERIENNVEFKKEVKTLEQAVRQCG
ncbi:MAG: chromosomal replication initiator protein DnaA [Deltaproteobacteria bacterium]|nr:chromosomal replication initiator protein DnaA [Deltaproteobacteria bacterium]